MKMKQTECSKTLAYKIHMLGYYPEESTQQQKKVRWVEEKCHYV